MRRIIFVAVMAIIAGVTFIGCEIDDKQTESNPYDIFGQYHNEAMQIIYDSAIEGKTVDLSDFACDFMANKMTKYSSYDYRFWMNRFDSCMNIINDEILPYLKNQPDIDFSNKMFSSLTDYQRTCLTMIFDSIKYANSASEYYRSLQSIEKEVLSKKKIQEWEKGIVLGTVSIAKYSFDFITKHFPEKKAPKWLERIKNVVKADAVGFVSGAVGSVISGHAAAATIFGPEGTVVMVATDATVGAISSSGVAVVGQIVGS